MGTQGIETCQSICPALAVWPLQAWAMWQVMTSLPFASRLLSAEAVFGWLGGNSGVFPTLTALSPCLLACRSCLQSTVLASCSKRRMRWRPLTSAATQWSSLGGVKV
jgi:hypothetical protein